MLTTGEINDLMYQIFILAIQLGGPVLVISMAVGVVISILQAATQIHEQTLTFLQEEFLPAMRAMFPLSEKREDTFVGGLSMGGYGAVKWALTFPQTFSGSLFLCPCSGKTARSPAA